jgi:hypothetical protein
MAVYTLFSQANPGAGLTSDATAYTMGIQFSVSVSGTSLTATWFYSPSGAAVLPQTIALYAVTGQSLVHSEAASWSGAAGSGWVRAAFASAPSLSSSTQYKACVLQNTAANWYSGTNNYWTTDPQSGGITNGPLTAPGNAGSAQGQDTFNAGSALTYPANTFSATNYWIDPEVTVSNGNVNGLAASVAVAAVYGTVTGSGSSQHTNLLMMFP